MFFTLKIIFLALLLPLFYSNWKFFFCFKESDQSLAFTTLFYYANKYLKDINFILASNGYQSIKKTDFRLQILEDVELSGIYIEGDIKISSTH